ncbi:transport protein Sec23, partial [Gregarina niphandrodes]
VIIWHGSLINKWVESQYHLLPQYQNLKALLQLPQMHANLLLKSRIPCPKFISCNAGGSQERFILARVNPSSTHKQGAGYDSYGGAGDDGRGTAILTEDVNMKTFMDHLIKLSVSS